MDSSVGRYTSTVSEPCILQTDEAHNMTHLSAIHCKGDPDAVRDRSVEIRPSKICAHSPDYFPVSASHLNFGQTLYWNKHSSQKHKLLALDFSGTITAVGKYVRKLKVGDQVASCYPVVAASKVRVPEDVCYSIKRFPFLQKTPCVSYFVLAWEILHRALSRAKHNLGIVSSVPDSALMKVLALTAYKSGWNVIVGTQCNGSFVNVNQMDVFVILPPFDESLIANICNFPAFLGNASQTNYAAAKTFLDMFCQYRRKIGLPGQSINWGALNLGLLLNKEHVQRFLEAKGMMVLDVAEIHQSIDSMQAMTLQNLIFQERGVNVPLVKLFGSNATLSTVVSLLSEGEGLDNFWKVLLEGKNCSVPIPKERFDKSSWYDPDDNKAGKSRTAKAALINGFNEFDHRFFGISDSEVEQMDPQQKQLLQCVYRALENAGIPMEKASGTRTGVYFGIMNRDYETNAAHVHPSVINHWTGTCLAMSIAANRVSYIFNFTGPSLSLDCACSSSLVALHLACQSIKQGDCEMAVCGGVNCIIEPRVFVALSKAKMISPEGTSKPFSNKADGYGRGEGCGVVLLKPLKKAIQDHDHIWGIISKTAVNQDGHSVSPITKPSMTQQEELLRRIYSESDLVNVQYIEAHGTGTPVGDQTEAGSISNVIAKAKPPGSEILRIGSVKSNIGHTESAAGVAGLIKVLLMMKHETICPSVFYSEETASVDAKALNIKVPKESEKWEALGPRIAGVNNFGFGGTNAHAIVKQHKQSHIEQRNGGKQKKYFVMSANSPKSLTLMTEDTIKQLDADSELDVDSLLYTSACRRSHLKHKYRKAIIVSSKVELKEKLSATLSKNVRPSLSDPRLVFVFCGNGVTYHGMCKQLLKHEPVFRGKMEEIGKLFQRLSKTNILDTLESEIEGSDFNKPHVIQPLLFAIQVGITTLLRYWGVKPDAILGHSVGEVAAAHCSGLLSLEDAVKVIYFRSTLQNRVTGGKMLVISNMAISEVTALLPCYSGKVCLAAFNSLQSCTLSGDADAIESIHKELSTSANSQNLFLRVLDVPAAYHSHMMDPILQEIEETIGSLKVNDLDTELFSTVTGKEVQHGDFCTGEYWARNIREPVAFEQAVNSATKGKKNVVFVEIGPRRALQRNIMESLGNYTSVLASVQPEKDHETLLSVVSNLFELGVQVNWDTFYRGYETMPLPIPKYQFDCSDRDVIIGAAQKNTVSNHPVLCQTGSESNIFSCDLMSDSSFYLKEHKHNNIPIIPGAFYAELGLAAFMASAKPKVPLCSLQVCVNFHSPFVLSQNSPAMKVQLEKREEDTKFMVLSPSAMYASGTVVSKKERLIEEQCISLSSIYKRCKLVVSSEEFYGYLSQGGFQYGDVFKNKWDVHYGEDLKEAFAKVTVPEELRSQLHDYYIHPVVLDFLMQLLPVTVEHIFAGRPGFPAKIGSLTVFEPLQDEMVVYLRAIDVGKDHLEICGCFADKQGKVLVEVKHVIIKYLGSRSHVVEEYFYHNAFSVIPEGVTSAFPPKALVFADSKGISKGLQQYLDLKSIYVPFKHAKDILSNGFPTLLLNLNITDIENNFDEVLFVWGKEDLTSLSADVVLQNLASCLETFRQIVLKLKQIRFPNSIRAVTYCSSDITVDHISPGFALAGMTRSFAAEIPELSFQLIDISSTSAKNIAALSEVLRSHPCSKYPELVVKDGLILKPSIVRTPPEIMDSSVGRYTSTVSEPCILQTDEAHNMTHLSAIHFKGDPEAVRDRSVEIRPSKICAHSPDYFPVSASHLNFGQTLYWNKHSSQKHKLLALDFSGTITAVGKYVRKLKVGDQVASCYPVVAASKVRVPEDVCYSIKRFPFLQKTPCVSYFVLAWEILHRALSRAKHNLGIAVHKDLCKKWGNAEIVLVALCLERPDVVDYIVSTFKNRLMKPPKKGSTISRFCSSVAKDFSKNCTPDFRSQGRIFF
ncbi:hypothetical protein JOQ06_018432 [Pogonophryne albipinna]|uniref:Uncharacterized protein n=1 Tax=Pogonophryne albipinna TaxID=1090488 RepID=A0AAD6AJ23_9TELE|nr:hypothetical protein JOQ06_018432 [Pogonophryne albipinna]